jgi:uncharacterized protein
LRETFSALMKLQEVDCRLRELDLIKGDMPQRVEALKAEIQSLIQQKGEIEAQWQAMLKEQQHGQDEVVLLREKLKKYQAQLYQVKNNREYDAITVETEVAEKEIETLELKELESDDQLQTLRQQQDGLVPRIQELEAQLADAESQLEKTLAVTRDEEQVLSQRRAELLRGLTRPMISTYDRIRQGRGGVALALLKEGACSECSSRIPPQRGLEIRQMEKMFLCEVCGRIMIWSPETERICNPK